MKNYLVVTVTCPDRPGVVEQITAVLTRFSANWEESRMARLGGEFAGIAKVSVPEARTEGLMQELQALNSDQMTVVVKPTDVTESESPPGFNLFDLQLSGADHEGIVHSVAAYLVEHGINVETMETEVVRAPVTAAPLFQMDARIRVPDTLSFEVFQQNLGQIGDELGVDINVRAASD
jgi:glycine cleavage system transcriptional repressor